MVDFKSKNWRELIKLKRIEISQDSQTNSYGKFICEPLERGFGITIGNSLRRILLSSLQGAAIVSVKFDGVAHEFSTIPGVLDDVTNITLNLKEIKLRLTDVEEAVIHLKKEGEGEAKAGDMDTHGLVEILNPDQHIATLNKDAVIDMEMVVKSGKGYVPAEKNKAKDQPIGVIALDAVFSPIEKVNYVVAYAAKIIKEHMNPFINFEEEPEPVEEEEEEKEEKLNENLFRSVSELELSVRSSNCLKNANITLIGELVQKSESEMLKTKNFGRKSLNEIKAILEEMELSLGMKLDNFPPVERPDRGGEKKEDTK
ncbi:MAG: DNA-directed RNA polymerase subunit alpha [Deltaproteobacteria bacterium]|nr:DNA-directed RNA polymerase subunit alpha [Deltaproteobacteria bacterium]